MAFLFKYSTNLDINKGAGKNISISSHADVPVIQLNIVIITLWFFQLIFFYFGVHLHSFFLFQTAFLRQSWSLRITWSLGNKNTHILHEPPVDTHNF